MRDNVQKGNNTPVAIVTGAGSGIGRATSSALAGQGFCLVLAGRRPANLAQTAAHLSTPHLVLATDIRDPEQASRMVLQAQERFGRIDVLVNNAGTIFNGGIGDHTPEAILTAFQVNAVGAAYAIRSVWPILVQQRFGCIVNISSSASLVTSSARPFAYAASKAALDHMTRCCAHEGQPLGVRAFCLNPGYVDTPMLMKLVAGGRAQPRRALSPEQVARVAVDCINGRHDKWIGRPIRFSANQLPTGVAGRADRLARRIWKGTWLANRLNKFKRSLRKRRDEP
jgi:NAD(P)-dependent dehydrogenase (short-subunit alcohol dehydrogenase family)